MATKPAKKRKGEVKENIDNLQFGPDFGPESGAEALLNAEVKVRARGGRRCGAFSRNGDGSERAGCGRGFLAHRRTL